MSGRQLIELFDESGFQIKRPFTRAVKNLAILQPNLIAEAVAEFMKEVYLNVGIVTQRKLIFLYLLDEINKYSISIVSNSIYEIQLKDISISSHFTKMKF